MPPNTTTASSGRSGGNNALQTPPYNPGQAPYTAVTRQFWGMLFNDHWIPSPVFCRLVDSLFIHLNSSAPRREENVTVSMMLKIQTVVAGGEEVKKLSFPLWCALLRAIWDNDGVSYLSRTDEDGIVYAALDRQNWLTSVVRDVQYDPEAAHQNWNKIISRFELRDPASGTPFPRPIPRIAFPLACFESAKTSRDRAIGLFLQRLVLHHVPTHRQYKKLVSTSGSIFCDKCAKAILGTRMKCKECFDFDECERCYMQSLSQSNPAALREHQSWHKLERRAVLPGTCVCDVCRKNNINVVNHCLSCRDYDECDACNFQALVNKSDPLAPASPHRHQYWHKFVQTNVIPRTFKCDVCGSLDETTRNHCQVCPDYDQCERCRRASIPQVSDPPPVRIFSDYPPSPAHTNSAPSSPLDEPPPYSETPTRSVASPPQGASLSSPVGQRSLNEENNIAELARSLSGLVNFNRASRVVSI